MLAVVCGCSNAIIEQVLPSLIRPRLRWFVVTAMVLGAVLTGALAAIVFHGASTPFDTSVSRELVEHLGLGWQVNLLAMSSPLLSTSTLGIVALVALANRRWNVAVFVMTGPLIAILLTEFVLKPVVGRTIDTLPVALTGAFPSGHETGVSSAALVVVVACGQLRMPNRRRAVVAIGLAAWVALAAIGLVRGFLHYPTDVIGALGVSTVGVFGTALAIDGTSCRARQ